jgi:benzoyl-CoA reductase/2-hydroxyglutaryl-CoA dehydratase subunit BcrC/BadD/HgdB
MEHISVSLSNTNYTQKAEIDFNLDDETYDRFNGLIQEIEKGLNEQWAAFVEIQGLSVGPVRLTITEYEQEN